MKYFYGNKKPTQKWQQILSFSAHYDRISETINRNAKLSSSKMLSRCTRINVIPSCSSELFVYEKNRPKQPASAAIVPHLPLLVKLFSIIRIDKRSLNRKFRCFILTLKVLRGRLRTKYPCHKTFFHLYSAFFYLLLWQRWCCIGYLLWVWWLHSDHMNTICVCNCVTKVDEILFHSTYLSESWNFQFLCSRFFQSGLPSLTSVLISWPETRRIIPVRYLFLI